ncbi:MAG TPA: hypothetical protein VKP67_14415 [Xanthobacteraceae bacterium]|nr:hypothetical protein [Xanthobacteraceae bacterium]
MKLRIAEQQNINDHQGAAYTGRNRVREFVGVFSIGYFGYCAFPAA